MNKLIISSDLGGTKTLMRASRVAPNNVLETITETRFISAQYPGFDALLHEFISTLPDPVDAACIAVAGPVSKTAQGDVASVTNLPWALDSAKLEKDFGIPQVSLINDFAAIGYAIGALPESDFMVLQTGNAVPHTARAVLGAGTGLGHACLLWNGNDYEVYPSEGGHVDFAPCDELQIELLRFLLQRHSHVSYERLVSGAGLVAIFEFLAEKNPQLVGASLRTEMQQGDAAAIISEYALADKSALARQSIALFANIYAAQAGNFALSILARDGVYLAGGILPKILPLVDIKQFLDIFSAKGRMSHLLHQMPVRIVMNTETGLIGATQVATRMIRR